MSRFSKRFCLIVVLVLVIVMLSSVAMAAKTYYEVKIIPGANSYVDYVDGVSYNHITDKQYAVSGSTVFVKFVGKDHTYIYRQGVYEYTVQETIYGSTNIIGPNFTKDPNPPSPPPTPGPEESKTPEPTATPKPYTPSPEPTKKPKPYPTPTPIPKPTVRPIITWNPYNGDTVTLNGSGNKDILKDDNLSVK